MSLTSIKTKVSESTAVGKIENFLNENGPTVSMIGALIALGITIYEAFKASDKVSEIKQNYEEQVKQIEAKAVSEPEKSKSDDNSSKEGIAEIADPTVIEDQIKQELKELKTYRNVLYILAYKWVIAGGSIAALLMFLCNYLNGAKIATVGAALALSEDKLKKTMKSAKEILPDDKVTELENKTLEKLVGKNFMDEKYGPVVIRPDRTTVGIGDIYVDSYSGIQFQFRGTEKELLEVFDRATDYCYRCHGLPVAKFYSMLGIPTPPCAWGNWGPNRPFKAHLEERKICGATFKTIIYDYTPGSLADAGCPNR